MTGERFNVVVVPFPFTDSPKAKRRPELVLSASATFNAPSGHCAMAMITSARHSPWPLDVPIGNLAAAGLTAPSVLRMKLFALGRRLILRNAGRLTDADAAQVQEALGALLGT